MKLKFKVGNIEVKEMGLNFGGIEIETEFTLEETTGVYDLQKKVIKELPEILTDLKDGAMKFQELDKEFNETARKEIEDEMVEPTQESLDTARAILNKFRMEFPTREEQSCQVNGVIADIDGFLRKVVEEGVRETRPMTGHLRDLFNK